MLSGTCQVGQLSFGLGYDYLGKSGRSCLGDPFTSESGPLPEKTTARLAFEDPTPGIYLARPCQHIKTAGCHPRLWTSHRLSEEVVSSLGQALDQIKLR